MRKKNKEKENNKRRKSFSGVFSHLNTTKKTNYSSEESNVVTNPKSKIVKWVLGGSVAVATIVGIAVPWSLSSCSIIAKLPINDSEIMYSIEINGQTISVPFVEFKNRVESYDSSKVNKMNKLSNQFNYSVLKKMYNEEREAYLKFKAIIDALAEANNSDLRVTKDQFGVDVETSFDDIKNNQRKKLESSKKQFQQSLGNGWLDKWSSELATNSIYGIQDLEKATTKSLSYLESKAVDYMTTTTIKTGALARFESASINIDKWTNQMLNWQVTKDIEYTNNNGVKQTITAAEANSFLKTFITNKNSTTLKNGVANDMNKLVVFETKSYIPEYRIPNKLLKELLPSFYNSAIISSFDLAIKPGENNLSAFTFDNKVIENLFKITQNPKSSLVVANQFAAISQLSNFKGASLAAATSPEFAKQNANDSQLIINLSGSEDESDASKTVGSSKIKIFSDFVASSSDSGSSTSNELNFMALTSSGKSFDNAKFDDYQLFSPKEKNPIMTFLDLFLSMSENELTPDFANNDWAEKYYKAIVAGTVPQLTLELIKLIKDNFDFNYKNKTFVVKTTLNNGSADKYNNTLSNIISAFTDNDKAFIGKLLAISFMDDESAKVNYLEKNNQPNLENYNKTVGYWALYELSPETYLYINKDGMKIFTRDIITKNNVATYFDTMVMNDLEKKVKDKPSIYDVASIYGKLNDENIINTWLINQQDNKMIFTYGLYEDYLEENGILDTKKPYDSNGNFLTSIPNEEQQKIKENVDKFIAYINAKVSSIYANNETNFITSTSVIDTMISSNKYYDFAQVSDKNNSTNVFWQSLNRIWKGNNTTEELINQFLGINNISSTVFKKIINIANPLK